MLERILGALDEVQEMIGRWAGETWEWVTGVIEEVHGLLEARREAARAELARQLEEIEATRAELERLREEREELKREVAELEEARAELRQKVEELEEARAELQQEVEEAQASLEQTLAELEETQQMLDEWKERREQEDQERELSEEELEEEEKRQMMEEWQTDEAGIELLFYTLSPYVPAGNWRLRGTFVFPEAIAYMRDLPDWMAEAGYIAVVIKEPGWAEVWVKEGSRSRQRRR